jgi:hypothetical protein
VTLANLREAIGKPSFGGELGPTVSLDDFLHGVDPDLHAGAVVEVDGARILVRKMRREKVMEPWYVTSSERREAANPSTSDEPQNGTEKQHTRPTKLGRFRKRMGPCLPKRAGDQAS